MQLPSVCFLRFHRDVHFVYCVKLVQVYLCTSKILKPTMRRDEHQFSGGRSLWDTVQVISDVQASKLTGRPVEEAGCSSVGGSVHFGDWRGQASAG